MGFGLSACSLYYDGKKLFISILEYYTPYPMILKYYEIIDETLSIVLLIKLIKENFMIKKTLFISVLALTLSIAGSQAFAKSNKSKGDSKKSSSETPSLQKSDSAPAPAAAAPAAAPASGGGMGTAVAAGVGGMVLGGLAGAAIASSMSGDGDKATTTGGTATATPSPLLKMTPEEAVKSATEMQLKASEAGFGFKKSDEMLKKAEELIAKDDAGKKQAHEIAVIVHTWAETGVKQADELKKVADKLGL